MKRLATLVIAAVLTALPAPALADAKITCKAGPRKGWASVDTLKSRLAQQGWRIKKALISGDCYEVYGKTPKGDNVESFFQPETLEKILILKRGKTLFRAKGY